MRLDSSPEGAAISNYNMGNTYLKLGRYQEAIIEYQTALRLRPDDPEALYKLGVIYNLQKRFEDAVREWTAALSINPDYELAKKGLEAIQERWKTEDSRK